MADIIGAVIGKIAGLLGFDGTYFRPVKTDAEGELQIDVLSSALPAGAAKEATLARVMRAVEDRTDIVYQGNHLVNVRDNVDTPSATETTIVSYTVDAGEVAYLYAFNLSAPADANPISVRLYLGATLMIDHPCYPGNPVWQGSCYCRAMGGQTVYLKGYHTAGANKWMNAYMYFIVVET